MKLIVEPEIFEKYPKARIGTLSTEKFLEGSIDVDGIENYVSNIEEEAYSKLSSIGLDNIPEIKEWRQIYLSFGCSPKKISSVESVVGKLLTDKKIFRIIPLVNLYNAICLKYLLPMGAHVPSKIVGDLRLTINREKTLPFTPLGLKQIEYPKNGEVIYRDDVKATCRAWNNKDCDEAKITQASEQIIFFVDGAPNVSGRVEEALKELKGKLKQFVGVESVFDIADNNRSAIELKA